MIQWSDEMFGYAVGHADADLSFDDRDNARFAPLAAVVDSAFTWGTIVPPDTVARHRHLRNARARSSPGCTRRFRNICALPMKR
jgi:hypothetical protein